MADYTISLTEAEEKALETVMINVQEWATNSVKARSKMAGKSIVNALISHCNENDIAIATGYDAQIDQAYSLGIAEKATAEAPDQPE